MTDLNAGLQHRTFVQRLRAFTLKPKILADGARPLTAYAPVAYSEDRTYVQLRGELTSVTLQPKSNSCWLEAYLTDSSGSVRLVWLGRHVIGGITAGRELTVAGRVTKVKGELTIFNPSYELL